MSNIVVLTRSSAPIEDLDVFSAAVQSLVAKMRSNRDVRGILVDMRAAPSRNDTAYEDATADLRRETYAFKRVAMLFSSVAGALQVKRLGGSGETPLLATTDEDAALEFAATRPSVLPPASETRPTRSRAVHQPLRSPSMPALSTSPDRVERRLAAQKL